MWLRRFVEHNHRCVLASSIDTHGLYPHKAFGDRDNRLGIKACAYGSSGRQPSAASPHAVTTDTNPMASAKVRGKRAVWLDKAIDGYGHPHQHIPSYLAIRLIDPVIVKRARPRWQCIRSPPP